MYVYVCVHVCECVCVCMCVCVCVSGESVHVYRTRIFKRMRLLQNQQETMHLNLRCIKKISTKLTTLTFMDW